MPLFGKTDEKEGRKLVKQLEKQVRQARKKSDYKTEAKAWEDLAYFYMETGELEQARDAWIEVLKLFQGAGERKKTGSVFMNLGAVSHKMNEPEESERFYRKALAVHEDISERKGAVQDYYNLAMLSASQSDFATAVTYLEKGWAIAEADEEDAAMKALSALLVEYLGNYYFHFCDYEKAIDKFRKLVSLGEGNDTAEWAVKGLCGLSRSYMLIGEYHDSFHSLEDAMECAENSESPELKARALTQISHVYLSLGDTDKARSFALKAKELIDEEQFPALSIRVYTAMAHVNSERGMSEKTREYLDRAMALAEATGNNVEQMNILWNYANVDLKEGRFREAYSRSGKALRIVLDIGDRLMEGYLSITMGKIYQRMGDRENALNCREKALQIADDIDVPELLWEAHYSLGRLYHSMKKFNDAYSHYRKAVETLDYLGEKIRVKYLADIYFQKKSRIRVYQDLITLLIALNRKEEASMYYRRVGSSELKNRLKHLIHDE